MVEKVQLSNFVKKVKTFVEKPKASATKWKRVCLWSVETEKPSWRPQDAFVIRVWEKSLHLEICLVSTYFTCVLFCCRQWKLKSDKKRESYSYTDHWSTPCRENAVNCPKLSSQRKGRALFKHFCKLTCLSLGEVPSSHSVSSQSVYEDQESIEPTSLPRRVCNSGFALLETFL